MLNYALAGALLAVSVLPASPLAAQNVTADIDQIADLLKDQGYQAKLQGEGVDRHIKTGMTGYNFLILPTGCDDDGEACKSVQFYVAFTPQTKPTLEQMNSYAAENRFGRIYLDKERDPVIEMDIDLEAGGMSEDLFMDNLAYWEAIMVAFAEFAFSNDED